MKASELAERLNSIVLAIGDAEIVLPSHHESRYESVKQLEVTSMLRGFVSGVTGEFERPADLSPLDEHRVAVIVLRY